MKYLVRMKGSWMCQTEHWTLDTAMERAADMSSRSCEMWVVICDGDAGSPVRAIALKGMVCSTKKCANKHTYGASQCSECIDGWSPVRR